VVVNFLFLVLGALLFLFMEEKGLPIPEQTDRLFPYISKNHLPLIGGMTFVLGVIAASYSSADSALTSMTTSFSIDFLKLNEQNIEEKERNKKRMIVHAIFSLILLVTAYVFSLLANESVIRSLLKAAGYTYGPLLGLFAFGMYTKIPVKDRLIPVVAIASVILSYLINEFSPQLLFGYQIGFEILLINGAITFIGLLLIKDSKKTKPTT
jgi:Na+/proline symporter